MCQGHEQSERLRHLSALPGRRSGGEQNVARQPYSDAASAAGPGQLLPPEALPPIGAAARLPRGGTVPLGWMDRDAHKQTAAD